jgi:type I restriction enzyme, S subunit
MKTLSFTISSFCKTGSGTTPSRDKYDRYFNGTIPWVKSGELRESIISFTDEKVTEAALAETSLKIAPKGAILVAMYGANVGRVGILGIDAATNQAVCYIVPDEDKACARYIFHALQQKLPEFILRSVGGAQPNISQEIIKRTEIFLPPLEEQKRIAEILDRAESLRAMRRRSIEQLNTLPEAIFLKMFGDPVKNPKNLSVEPLGDFLLFMTSGGRGWAQFYAQSGSRFIRSLDVQMNYIGDEDIAFVAPPDNAEARRTRVKTGDVLLTITGSRIGRVAAVPDELEKSYISQHVAILRTDPNRISPMFLAFFLSLSTGGQRQIAKYQYGQTKPGLNFEQIKRFQIPLPSINLQQEFVQRVEAIEKLKTTHQKSLTELDALFASLQHRAFRGEL